MSNSQAGRERPRGRRAGRLLLSVVVVVAIFAGVLPQVADLSEVGRTVRALTGLEVATALAVAGWNLWSYWLVQVSSLPGLQVGQAAVVTQSATSLANTVPAGAAVGVGVVYRMYTSWGFSRSAVTLSLLASGIWNTLAKVAMPVVALGLLALQGDAGVALVTASLVGVVTLVTTVVVFAVALRSDHLARRVGTVLERIVSRIRRLARRDPVTGWAERASEFRAETIDLLARRWLALTASTVVSHLSLFAVLMVVLRHVGVSAAEVSVAEAFGAFAFVRLISALPITPGGLGVVELGLTAALVVAGGEEASVVAGVLVYRALTYLLPIPLVALDYLWWRRRGGQRPATAEGSKA